MPWPLMSRRPVTESSGSQLGLVPHPHLHFTPAHGLPGLMWLLLLGCAVRLISQRLGLMGD